MFNVSNAGRRHFVNFLNFAKENLLSVDHIKKVYFISGVDVMRIHDLC